ncbi:hypothetical protein PR202_gb21171 [Eleusine coracana subsp. coracana]|uniref:Proteasome inhibitor PI31 subunit n=1 Tax=Eleusine coracana subsp. coracana TaxID=191504 RepID=A0AAV5FCK2_ELECO|nr:hypothetical protein PR202_gb21171 [Eleusine coracana subsp. coracana]
MVTDAAAMAVVRAARPTFRGAHDGVAFAAHAAFLAAGYSLCAVGPAALTDPPPSGDEEVGIDCWNSMENCYAFLYNKEEKGKKKRVLVKCLVIGDLLAIDVLDLEAQDKAPYNVQINIEDFFSEKNPKNYGDMYKNFAGLIENINSNVLSKLDGSADAVAAKKTDAESSSSMQRYSYILAVQELLNLQGILVPGLLILQGCTDFLPFDCANQFLFVIMCSLVYPPIAPLGSDDLYPAPGAGFYPHSGIGGGGSMHVGPNDPRFFPSNPFPAPFGGPGSVPPGGRYDPIGPPDVPGFEPSRFVR